MVQRHRLAGAEGHRPRLCGRPAVRRGRPLRRPRHVEVGRRRRVGGQGRLRHQPQELDHDQGLVRRLPDCTSSSPSRPRSRAPARAAATAASIMMDRYEIQILDSYNNKTYFDGQCGSVYKQMPPMVNACRKPGEWQTYDILWEAPQFKADGGGRTAGLRDGAAQRRRGPEPHGSARRDRLRPAADVREAPATGRRSSCNSTATRCGSATSGCAR